MEDTQLIMGMPITIEVVDKKVQQQDIDSIFDFFISVDERFSPYKPTSEVAKINRGEVVSNAISIDMQEILLLSEQTKQQTDGYFNIYNNGILDPSGIVKGWAIQKAADTLRYKGFQNFYINAGGDIQVSGKNAFRQKWKVGIRNPFQTDKIVKTLRIYNKGIATSGTYIRGNHIYSPHKSSIEDIVSITVIGSNIYDADRFATAAFAMGRKGIDFINQLSGFEGYMIDKNGIATYTEGFRKYCD